MALARNAAGKVFRRAHNGHYQIVKDEAKAFFQFAIAQTKVAEALFAKMETKPCDGPAFEQFLLKLILLGETVSCLLAIRWCPNYPGLVGKD